MISNSKKIVVLFFAALFAFSVCAKNEFDVYKCVDNNDMKIALTFDDGPHSFLTPEILDILDQNGVKATFFVVGKNIDENPDILRRIVDDGHEVGNHTETHVNCCRIGYKGVIKEIETVHEKVLEICDYEMKLFRPPGGSYNKKTKSITEAMKYSIVLWSVDTKDWAHTEISQITDNILQNVRGGSIILFHDYIAKNSPTPDALKIIIPDLLDKGYSFVTVGELINEYGKV